MSATAAATTAAVASPARSARARGTLAVVAALVATIVVTTLTDQLCHVLGVYPPWGEPMHETGDNLLALGYRTVYGVLGGWLAARLAPRAPMRHALAYGAVGLALSAAGAAVAIARFDLGPDWYPILLAAVALPSAWLGGALHGGPRRAR